MASINVIASGKIPQLLPYSPVSWGLFGYKKQNTCKIVNSFLPDIKRKCKVFVPFKQDCPPLKSHKKPLQPHISITLGCSCQEINCNFISLFSTQRIAVERYSPITVVNATQKYYVRCTIYKIYM